MEADEKLLGARFLLNMQRVNALVALVEGMGPLGPKAAGLIGEGPRGDLLRAIVVFLHATFEDMLRTAARQRLAAAKSEILNDIPLAGTSRSGRAEKFYLGALDAHRGKTVEQLIHESVQCHLDRESFSSCADVDEVLQQMGLDTAPFKIFYRDLDQMITRRHRIVHQADLAGAKDTASPPWTFVDELHLALWILIVITFQLQLRVSIDPADDLHRWFLASRLKAVAAAQEARDQIATLRGGPTESFLLNLQKTMVRLRDEVTAFLIEPSDEELIEIWRKMKAPDDELTEDQCRAKIAVWRAGGG